MIQLKPDNCVTQGLALTADRHSYPSTHLRSARVCAVGWPVFEHREPVVAPLGGGTIAH